MSDWINDRPLGAPPSHRNRGSGDPSRPAAWNVVIPVKGGPRAKSRLRAPDGVDRLLLARAFALDTVAAACAAVGARHVVVVTSDPEVDTAVRALDVAVEADRGGGLNAAVRTGIASLPQTGRAAVLLGDVPAVRPSELVAALTAALGHRSAFVPDAESTGTVLLAGRDGSQLVPRFGTASAAAHAVDGHAMLDLPLPGLRRDVDDERSLREALGLGVGAHTAGLLAHLIAPA